VEQVLEKSEGVFLYIKHFCDDVQQNQLTLDRPERFPQGLGGIFFQWFRRQFPDMKRFRKGVRPALRAILAACEPLPVKILQRLLHWQDEELRDFSRTIGSLFPITTEANGQVIKAYHKSLVDWLGAVAKAGEFFVSAEEGHRLLAEIGWKDFERKQEPVSPYFIGHLHHHLMVAERLTDLAEWVMTTEFLAAAARRIGPSGNTGGKIAEYIKPYVEAAFHRSSKQSERLSSLRVHLSAVCASLELIYARRSHGANFSNDPKAICTVCGSAGIIHGHIDLGGVDCADNYFALCLSCFWAWHEEQLQQFYSAGAPREFNYATNTY
jgi:hypothetical protein